MLNWQRRSRERFRNGSKKRACLAEVRGAGNSPDQSVGEAETPGSFAEEDRALLCQFQNRLELRCAGAFE